jgi:ABC-type xylose transport system permease subunit
VVTLRYLDVCLVLATAPFVLVAGMPVLGYVVGACAWLLTRAGTALVHAQANRTRDAKVKAGLQVAGMMGRIWIVALAVILAKYAGGKDDGIMAAVLVLAAFTVYFVMSFVTRDGPFPRTPSAQGRPSPS